MSVKNQTTVSVGKLSQIFKYGYDIQEPVIAVGPPGVGKTESFRQFAEAMRQKLGEFGSVEFIASQKDVTDFSFPVVRNDEMSFYYTSQLPLEGNEARFPEKAGAVFFDEVTNCEPAIQKFLFQLFLDKKLGDRRLLPGWTIFAAGNRASDRSYTVPLAAPLANRMVIVNVEASVDDWATWALNHDIAPIIIAYIRWRPDHLHEFKVELYQNGEMAFPTPRSWTKVSKILSVETMDRSIRQIMLAGCLGTGVSGDFESYFRTWKHLPDLDEITRTGRGKVPSVTEAPGIMIAVVEALVHRASKSNLGNILNYIGNLPIESQVLYVKEMERKDNNLLTKHPAYTQWAVKNGDKLI